MTPEFYPQKLDLAQGRVLMIRMREEDYRAASFLDDRMLTAESKAAWVPLDRVMANAQRIEPRSLHFIFHTGHVGSTLLSRLLGEARGVLSLREPLPLRSLADAFDAPVTDGLRENALAAFLKLWGRGYELNHTVVLKATSNAARMGERMMQALPGARAVYLSLPRESAIEALLSSQYAKTDLEVFGPERFRRLQAMLGDARIEQPRAVGELAAMSWAAERLTQRHLSERFGARILNLDFEDFLSDMRPNVERVMAHFGLEATPQILDALMKSPILSQYSKKPAHPYSTRRRTQILAETRVSKADEIARAQTWLENLTALPGASALAD
ncbi:MAG TPA: hypothetical protein VGM36_08465 [Rhizomicrobium sp.]